MLSNDFIHELDIEFDTNYLLSLVEKTKKEDQLKAHQRLVSNDPYLTSIKEKYPFLSSIWNYYDFVPFRALAPHIDTKRRAALNIPLTGTAGSKTFFYDINKVTTRTYDTAKVLDWIDTDLEPVFSFELSRPTIINNSLPHSVSNGKYRRVILSWSILSEYDLKYIKSLIHDPI